jgi:hypothetical protein
MLQQFFVSFYVQIYDTLSFADPDSHGSAFILVSWIRIRIRIGNTDPQSETNADPQHCSHLIFAIFAMSLVHLPLLLFQELTEYELAPVVYNPGNYKY